MLGTDPEYLSWFQKSFDRQQERPSGLKPVSFLGLSGMAQAVPFLKPFLKSVNQF
jgi:hypothetical protein